MSGPGWHRFEPTDAYFAYDLEFVFVGVEVPPATAVRGAVAELAAKNPEIFRATDLEAGCWRPFSAQELQHAPEHLVSSSAAGGPHAALVWVAGAWGVGQLAGGLVGLAHVCRRAQDGPSSSDASTADLGPAAVAAPGGPR